MLGTKRLNKLIAQEKNAYKAIAQFDRLSRTYNNVKFKQLAAGFLEQVDDAFSGALIVCDIVGRLGGDEFVIMLHRATDVTAVETVYRELKEKSRKMVSGCDITLSIGVVIFRGRADFEGLFKLADAALYDVKNSGKDAFKICTAQSV